MGFGAIVGQITFIMLIMIVVANVIIANESNTRVFTEAKKDNSKIFSEYEESDIFIENVSVYGAIVKSINITIKNSGKIKMNVEHFDFYIDGERITKGIYTITHVVDILNPKIFDPEEIILIRYDDIPLGNHHLAIVNEFGKRAEKIISVS